MTPQYLAGLFDGEGYFTLRRVKGTNINTTREFRYQAYAQITLREGWLLEQAVAMVGAGVVAVSAEATEKRSKYYIVTWCGKALPTFLWCVGPHLIAKHKQMQVIEKVVQIKTRTGNQPTSDSDYDLQCELWKQLKVLNTRGVGK